MICLFRTCASNLRSWNGFQYPEEGWVEATLWNPAPVCGDGLHGLIEGVGDIGLLYAEADAVAQVIVCKVVVDIDGMKGKTPRGYVFTFRNWQSALAEYKMLEQSARAEYEMILQPAWEKYKMIERSAWEKYKMIAQSSWLATVQPFLDEARQRFAATGEKL